jgi:archaellum component FlaF (FlaF/FlaG flagellin family)
MVNPNPFSPAERDYLRALFGSSYLFSSSNSQFENVLNSIDGLYDVPSDMGATQAAIRTTLSKIENVETQLTNLTNLMLGSEVEGKVKINAVKNDVYLRFVVGPALITQISNRLSFPPLIAYFNPASTQNGGQAIVHRIS